MKNIPPYLTIVILLPLVIAGCSGNKHFIKSEIEYSETLQRNYFEAADNLLKGDNEAAYSSFSKCSEEEPENPVFHYKLGRIDYDLGRFEAAIMHYDLAIKGDEINDWYRYHRGLTLIATHDFEGALSDFKVWVTERPGDLEALDECATFFQNAGQELYSYKLLDFYEKSIAKNVEVRLQMFDLLVSSKQIPGSSDSFIEKAFLDFPTNHHVLYLKASGEAYNKNHNTAIEIFEALVKDHPFNASTLLSLADSYTAVGRPDEAFELLLKVFNHDSGSVTKKLELLNKYSVLAKSSVEILSKYDLLLNAAVNTHPENTEILHLYAIHLIALGEIGKSAVILKKVTDKNPGSLAGHYDYLSILFELRQWEEVVSATNKASLVFPLEPLLFLYSGDAYIEMQRFDLAVDELNKGRVLLLDPSQVGADIYSELAKCYRELDMLDDSYNAFEMSLKIVESPYTMNTHAYFLALDNKRMGDAFKWSLQANHLLVDNPHFMDTHALILSRLDKNSEALMLIVRASALLTSPNPVFLQREGEIRIALGEVEKGERLLDRAKELREE